MPTELKTYLQWRFRVNNHNKYLHYLDEWLSNVTNTQLEYFNEEMHRCINLGIYKL